MTERVNILNGRFDPLSLPQTVEAAFGMLNDGGRGYLATVNVAVLMMMRKDPRLQRFVDGASLVVADGQPLVWCSSLFGARLPERVTGVALVDALCARAAKEGRRVYLLGAAREVAARVAMALGQRHPGLRVDWDDGYFPADRAAERADRVRASGADILFVGMGVPRQEVFIEEQWERLHVGIAIGVGGSFDVLAGLRARAPAWVSAIGMEWLFRLVQEPRRLFRRYLVTNSQFVVLLIAELFRKGKKK
jgi:N-acetylglucosaminyldiphosphoundecaprenol N-acetyl-beta-D-mannosaminyltransferase